MRGNQMGSALFVVVLFPRRRWVLWCLVSAWGCWEEEEEE